MGANLDDGILPIRGMLDDADHLKAVRVHAGYHAAAEFTETDDGDVLDHAKRLLG